jgi:hypothetical protein
MFRAHHSLSLPFFSALDSVTSVLMSPLFPYTYFPAYPAKVHTPKESSLPLPQIAIQLSLVSNSFRIRTYEKHARNPFGIRTSKTKDLNSFRIRTYKKRGRGRGFLRVGQPCPFPSPGFRAMDPGRPLLCSFHGCIASKGLPPERSPTAGSGTASRGSLGRWLGLQCPRFLWEDLCVPIASNFPGTVRNRTG